MIRNGRRALFLAVVALLVALVMSAALAGETVLPALVSRVLAAHLAGQTAAGNVDVKVEARPAWRLLRGEASYLRLDLREARFGQLPVDSFVLDAYDLALDPAKLWRKGELLFRRHGVLRATLRLTESDLNQYLWNTTDREKAFRLILGPGSATAEGSVKLLGQKVPLRLKGRFRVEPPLTLRFLPTQFYLGKVQVPRAFLENVVAQVFAVEIPARDLPVRVRLTDLRVEPGRLFLFAAAGPGE